ncbi:outer membrane lipoprotein chaperone LolA [Campylobacter sp. FMV-PI01]|uniref:Outer membrane lipoprotein chaperone LolA n=1 Tax=Campylobacter portucalensis TaxID=2608384 RepID=A0A6L5WGY4_9BACT|nr:LolA-like outer membrane lipoprotein chaperone [Campylobacter portucalensis]MSN96294.1 outer membrane lipoprotein chaperone LolA [Campylobacter portucalensis]
MKKMKFISLFLIFFLNFAFCYELEFKTLSADFIQTIKNKDSKIIYSGNFFATNSAAFWSYKTPNLKDIYFNKTQVVVIEPELEQVILTNLKDIPNLIKVLKNAKKLKPNLYSANFNDILYKIELKDSLLYKIDYKDNLDNEVEIVFSEVKKDENLNQDLFLPKIPDGFDIIMQ